MINLGFKKVKEVSALTNFGVSEVFHEIIEALLLMERQHAPSESDQQNLLMDQTIPQDPHEEESKVDERVIE